MTRRKLGTMVIEEQDEILRITCGRLLKALITWEIPPGDLWPVEIDSRFYSGFPASSQTEKHWNNAFQTYVDQLFTIRGPSQGSAYRMPAVVNFINKFTVTRDGYTLFKQ